MVEKFSTFDEYQLAKYNKEKSQNKKKLVTYFASDYHFLVSIWLVKCLTDFLAYW